jgi:anthranilate 1,2-dioxygenase large subunit
MGYAVDHEEMEEGLAKSRERVVQILLCQEIYELEQRRLFRGPVWNDVALESEIPNPGDFKANFVGDTPIVVARGRDGAVHAFVNRCAHRGALVCREMRGSSMTHIWIYHQ